MIAIFFDVDDTLYDQMVPFANACREVWGECQPEETEALFAAYRRRSDEVFEASQRGEITMEEMYIHRGKFLEDFGRKVSGREALQLQNAYREYQNQIEMTDLMKKTLQLCAGHQMRMGIITNGPTRHQRDKISRLHVAPWISEHEILVSQEVGCMKPEPAIFDRAKEIAGPAEEYYFVGDSLANDILGAQKSGWKAIWMNRRNQVCPDTIRPEATAASEEELYAILSGLAVTKTAE